MKQYLLVIQPNGKLIIPEQLEFQSCGRPGINAQLSLHDVNGILFQSGQAITIRAEQQVQFMGSKVSVTTPKEMTVF